MERNQSYNLLRIIATFYVILIHSSIQYIHSPVEAYPWYYLSTGLFFNVFTRVAVPAFTMLSGALLLNKQKNTDVIYFYKKTIKCLIIPTILIGIFYVFYSSLYDYIINGIYTLNFKDFLKVIYINGIPYYHLWYMYMIIPMYLFTPFLLRLKVKNPNILYSIAILLIVIYYMTGNSINLFRYINPYYLGLFIFGDFIRNKVHKNGFKFLIISFTLSILAFLSEDNYFNFKINFLLDGMNPTSIANLLSVLFLFAGFSGVVIKNFKFDSISRNCFGVYLIHPVIISVVNFCSEYFIFNNDFPNPILNIPIVALISFVFSCIIVCCYKKIYKLIFSVKE